MSLLLVSPFFSLHEVAWCNRGWNINSKKKKLNKIMLLDLDAWGKRLKFGARQDVYLVWVVLVSLASELSLSSCVYNPRGNSRLCFPPQEAPL